MIGQFVVGETTSRHDIRTHVWTPPVSLKDPEWHPRLAGSSIRARFRERVSPAAQGYKLSIRQSDQSCRYDKLQSGTTICPERRTLPPVQANCGMWDPKRR